jgi:hypothetical protein
MFTPYDPFHPSMEQIAPFNEDSAVSGFSSECITHWLFTDALLFRSFRTTGRIMSIDLTCVIQIKYKFRVVFWVILPCKTSVDNNFTRLYIPEDNSEHHVAVIVK